MNCLFCRETLRSRSPESTLQRRIANARKLYGVCADRAESEVRAFHQFWKDRYGKWNGMFCTDRCAIKYALQVAEKVAKPCTIKVQRVSSNQYSAQYRETFSFGGSAAEAVGYLVLAHGNQLGIVCKDA